MYGSLSVSEVVLYISIVIIKNPAKFWFNTHTRMHIYSKYCNIYFVSIAFHHGRQNKCPLLALTSCGFLLLKKYIISAIIICTIKM